MSRIPTSPVPPSVQPPPQPQAPDGDETIKTMSKIFGIVFATILVLGLFARLILRPNMDVWAFISRATLLDVAVGFGTVCMVSWGYFLIMKSDGPSGEIGGLRAIFGLLILLLSFGVFQWLYLPWTLSQVVQEKEPPDLHAAPVISLKALTKAPKQGNFELLSPEGLAADEWRVVLDFKDANVKDGIIVPNSRSKLTLSYKYNGKWSKIADK